MRLRNRFLLVAGVAAVVLWGVSVDRPAPAPEVALQTPDPGIGAPVGAAPAQATPPQAEATSPSTEAPLAAPGRTSGDTSCAARFRVLVLPIMRDNANQQAIQAVESIKAALLSSLRGFPNLELVDITDGQIAAADIDATVTEIRPGFRFGAGAYDLEREIVNHYGGDLAISVRSVARETDWMVGVAAASRSGAVFTDLVTRTLIEAIGDSEDAAGRRFGERIYTELAPACAQAIRDRAVTDRRLSDVERFSALRDLFSDSRTRNSLSDEVLASAIELARNSLDPSIRLQAWGMLGQLADPVALVPMRDALLADADANVRAVVADALYSFMPDATVAAALQAASVSDPSDHARLHARWSLMSFVERASYTEAALRDSSLSEERKVAPLALFRVRYDDALSAEALALIHELALQGNAPSTRAAALRELGRSGAREYFDSLVNAARSDPDPGVRRAAISSLQALGRDSIDSERDGYRRAFVDTLKDPDPSVRAAAAGSLSAHVDDPATAQALQEALARETDASARERMESALSQGQPSIPILRGEGFQNR